jgi:hypothetical protein
MRGNVMRFRKHVFQVYPPLTSTPFSPLSRNNSGDWTIQHLRFASEIKIKRGASASVVSHEPVESDLGPRLFLNAMACHWPGALFCRSWLFRGSIRAESPREADGRDGCDKLGCLTNEAGWLCISPFIRHARCTILQAKSGEDACRNTCRRRRKH